MPLFWVIDAACVCLMMIVIGISITAWRHPYDPEA